MPKKLGNTELIFELAAYPTATYYGIANLFINTADYKQVEILTSTVTIVNVIGYSELNGAGTATPLTNRAHAGDVIDVSGYPSFAVIVQGNNANNRVKVKIS